MLSDIFSFSFTLFLPNWLLISIRIYSGIARFPCDSMAFLSDLDFANDVTLLSELHKLLVPALEMMASEAAFHGLEVNWQKTKLWAAGMMSH